MVDSRLQEQRMRGCAQFVNDPSFDLTRRLAGDGERLAHLLDSVRVKLRYVDSFFAQQSQKQAWAHFPKGCVGESADNGYSLGP